MAKKTQKKVQPQSQKQPQQSNQPVELTVKAPEGSPPEVVTVAPLEEAVEVPASYVAESPAPDPSKPVEGQTIVHENGDIETFTNGAWVVKVSHSTHTGQ